MPRRQRNFKANSGILPPRAVALPSSARAIPLRRAGRKPTMSSNLVLALALGIGVIAGLRALTAPATVSWAAHLGWIQDGGTHLSFMSSIIAVVILTLAAIAEIV